MTDFGFRLFNGFLGSEAVPAFLRMRLMRMLGFDVAPSACVWAGANLRSNRMSLGAQVFINTNFYFDGAARLDIEDNVRIGPYVRVITATHEIGPSDHRCTMEAVKGPVRIGKGCWIGACVTILPGVVIAPGCVIAANALVVSSTEPDGLYIGAPARRVRDLPLEGERAA